MPTSLAEKPVLAEKTSLAARLRARKPLPLPLWLCLYGAAVLLVGVSTAAGELQNADFLATNGDYQTYNVLRRAIAGQVPYLDFANYLGMGPLVTIAPAVRLWNQLQGSMFFATFATACMFTLFAGLVLFLVSGHKTASAAASILLPKLLTSGLVKSFVPFYGYYANYYFELLLYPQKSLRMVRLFLAVLLTAAALLVRRRCRGRLAPVLGSWPAAPLCGLVLGLGVVWSNDFGVACLAAGFVVLLALWVKSAWGRPLPVLQVPGKLLLWLAGAAGGGLCFRPHWPPRATRWPGGTSPGMFPAGNSGILTKPRC